MLSFEFQKSFQKYWILFLLYFILFLKKYIFNIQKMVLKANIYYIFILFSLFSIFFLCVSFIYQFKNNANFYYISILLTHFVFFVYIFQRYFYKKIQYYSSIFTLLYSLKNIFNTQKMAIKINSYYISISFFTIFYFFFVRFICIKRWR